MIQTRFSYGSFLRNGLQSRTVVAFANGTRNAG